MAYSVHILEWERTVVPDRAAMYAIECAGYFRALARKQAAQSWTCSEEDVNYTSLNSHAYYEDNISRLKWSTPSYPVYRATSKFQWTEAVNQNLN